jgi:DNA-binding response OmpR family regulator
MVHKVTGDVMVLVVEDDRDMRSLLCDELEGEGYRLAEASTGDEALEVALMVQPRLIITDLRMPSGGFDYVLRLHAQVPNSPIIVVTSFGDPRTRRDALRSGVAAYFDKPVHLADLKDAVKRLLAHSGGSMDGEDSTDP